MARANKTQQTDLSLYPDTYRYTRSCDVTAHQHTMRACMDGIYDVTSHWTQT